MVSGATGAGIGLAVVGFVLALFGGIADVLCSSAPVPGVGGCGGFLAVALVGAVLGVIGVVVAVASFRSYTYLAPTVNPAVPPPLVTPVVVHETVQQNIVRVRCRYCGALGDPAVGRCAACGAPL